MSKLLGVTEAAFVAGVSRKRVHSAMETDALMWKDIRGHQVTTNRWLRSWLKGQA